MGHAKYETGGATMRFETAARRRIGVLSLITILLGSFLILQGSILATTTLAAPTFDEDEQVSHPLAGRENCVSCHQPGTGDRSSPRNHAGRSNDVCLTCHVLKGESGTLSRAGTIPHPIQGWGNCTLCHQPGAGLRSSPSNHAGIRDNACQFCHVAGNTSSGTLPGGPILGAGRPTPHPRLGRENCFLCHQPSAGIRPSPQSHAGLAMESCLYCHQPVDGRRACSAGPATGWAGTEHPSPGRWLEQLLPLPSHRGGHPSESPIAIAIWPWRRANAATAVAYLCLLQPW